MTTKALDLGISEIQEAVQNQLPVLFDLSDYGIIQVRGPDTVKFLQGQLTCDLVKLQENQAVIGALCSPKGRIIALFDLLKVSSTECWLLLPKETLELTLTTLKKFGVFFPCDITDNSEDFSIVGQLKTSPETSNDSDANLSRQILQSDSDFIVSWAQNRTVRISPTRQTESFLEQAKKENPSTKIFSEVLWRYLDIEQGRARLHKSTQETFLPHNLNLHEMGGISFDKGCYTGQEVVARMHYKGKLKSHLFRLFSDDACQTALPGEPIYGENEKIGEVVTCAKVGEKALVLGFCKDKIENLAKIQCNLENTSILSMLDH
ncbi:MAG: folate-binding protein YgfZ [Gammaproteobacteria bacterium]|nr:folate-binding protein YgfZ [Gammaproteobacteria bacterium]